MDAISCYFQGNLDIVYFIYGTAFAVMGIVIILQPKKGSILPLADSLNLLGWFGVTHGINELLEMWMIVKRSESATFGLIMSLVLVTSYICLFEFGRRILRAGANECSPRLAKASRLLIWQILPAIIILLIGLAAVSSAFIKNVSILSRYLLGFPGAVLSGVSLLSYYRCKAVELQNLKAKNYFIIAGLAFIAYGVLGGLIPQKGYFFPANLLNTETFFSITGLPVQLLRTSCALLISWAIIGTVRIFNWERDEIIQGVIFNNSADCIENISLDGRFLVVNTTCLLAYGFTGPWEIIGKDAAAAVTVNTKKFSEAISRAAMGSTSTLQYSSTDRNGREFWWDAVVSPVRGMDDKIKSVLCIAKDITGQLVDREKIRRNQETQFIINAILNLGIEAVSIETILGRVLDRILAVTWLGIQKKGAIFLTDYSGNHLIMKAQRGFAGQAERACSTVPLGRCLCGKAALSGKTIFTEDLDERHEIRYAGIKPHGHYCVPIKIQNKILGVLNLYVPTAHKYDESERDLLEAVCAIIAKIVDYKNLEARAYQIQKLESLGRFAGAIAHDFNNILAGIKGFNSLAQDTMPQNAKTQRYLKETDSSIDKGAALLKQILAFSRNQPAEMGSLDLNAVIADMESMLKVILAKNIRLKLSISPELPRITGNKSQLQQIIVNLAVNASDAMPKGGEFSITTMSVEPGDGGQCMADLEPSRRAVKMSISDTGCGIPENLIERVFEPFFTTKPEGKGTGLGLSTVYSLVKLHKGGINMTSLVGQGTTFDICFPASAPQIIK